ncbi:MAG: long-chain-acyl-CoA synthetase, partial [Xanthobacteraceae bacterium]
AWYRTGDLMRMNGSGFFYFVDRIGDTFRWKGENVATSEVAAAILAFPGIVAASVYGVGVRGTEGAAGMATLVVDGALDFAELRRHLAKRLPDYARPLFLRIKDRIEVTATFKYKTAELARQGFDPALISDPIYFDNPEQHAYVPLDQPLYRRIGAGQIRL